MLLWCIMGIKHGWDPSRPVRRIVGGSLWKLEQNYGCEDQTTWQYCFTKTRCNRSCMLYVKKADLTCLFYITHMQDILHIVFVIKIVMLYDLNISICSQICRTLPPTIRRIRPRRILAMLAPHDASHQHHLILFTFNPLLHLSYIKQHSKPKHHIWT